MEGMDFVALDFETATAQRASVCEVGVCVVRGGQVAESHSWLVRPIGNEYNYWNIRIHGIRPADTACSPDFPEVWSKVEPLLAHSPVLVAHNAAFDISCLRSSLELYGMAKPAADYCCTLRAARHLYDFPCNTLDYLCEQFGIPLLCHHRAGDDAEACARLFLREARDAGWCLPAEMSFCRGRL